MAISKDDILNAVSEMSVMDLNELVKAFEEKIGVSAAAMAAPAALKTPYLPQSLSTVGSSIKFLSFRDKVFFLRTAIFL